MRSSGDRSGLEKSISLASKARQTLPSLLYFHLIVVLLLVGTGDVASAQGSDAVVIPSAEVEMIVGPQLRLTTATRYFDQIQSSRGVQHGTNFPATPPTSDSNGYINDQYYDLGLCLYALYYRSGDPTHLALARKVTDSWWSFSPFNSGATPLEQSFAPRNASLGGLMLRAMDGRPEMWDWLQRYTRYQFDIWLKLRVNNSALHYGIRDGAYMLQYAAWMAKALPDSYPLQSGGMATNGAALRAGFLADVENVAVNYYARLQYPDGSWRWDDFDNVPQPDGGYLHGIMQPFMVGLLLHSLIDVYRATSNTTIRATLKTSILKCVDHLYTGGPYMTRNAGIAGSTLRWRAFNYLYHGGTTVNPTKYANGDYYGINAPNIYSVEGARQNSSTILHAFGWAYSVTGDSKYATWGNDIYDSIFGFTEDQVSNYVAGNDPKGYNQHYRAAGRYLAWRYGTNPPTPAPSNPIDGTPFFVRQQYLDFLNREPDPGLYAVWQQIINSCQQGDPTCDRVHVSLAFFQSAEFQGRGYFVYRFYPVSFGRKPDYKEFTSDIAKVSGFLTDAELAAAKVAFITEFMSRPGFVTKFNGLTDTQYVDTLLATAGLTSPNRDFWIAALGNGMRTRATVLRDVLESTEVYNRYYNQAFVVMQYFGYLRRDPDASYLDWIEVLNSSQDFRGMVNGFMNSPEYRARFGL